MAYKQPNKAIKKIGKGSYSINISKVKSDDPLAYSYGYVQGREGVEFPKEKNLAPAYVEGYKRGKKERIEGVGRTFNLPSNVKSKEEARDLAQSYQMWASEQNLSYSELATYGDYFENLGRKFGLLREFKENGII